VIRIRERVQNELDRFRQIVGADFAALACEEKCDAGVVVRWKYASGNRNNRYQRIVLRPDKGFAGKVMRLGRPVTMEFIAPKSGDDPREYPILLAEGLRSLVGVPVYGSGRIQGVLLIGCRTSREFTESDIRTITQLALELEQHLGQS
jgi:nitrogen regulatory protein A